MPVPQGVEKLERSLFRHEAYATLHEWIVEGTLRPGERVRDQELARSLGVSRAPVRDALQRLEAEGLVETAANRWTRVAPIAVGDAEDIFPILESLELLAVRLADGGLAPAELEALVAANERARQAVRDGLPVAAEAADREFHHLLLARSGNAELVRIATALRVRLRRITIAYLDGVLIVDPALRQHEAIVAALRDRDREGAARAVAAHWQGGCERFFARAGAGGGGASPAEAGRRPIMGHA